MFVLFASHHVTLSTHGLFICILQKYDIGDDLQKKRNMKPVEKDMDVFYAKLCDVLGVVAVLADEHCLPDATLLQVNECMLV